jgi:general secretion pathway protein J
MKHARGFTLLELLVSMTLLALILTLLFGGLRTGTRVWEASAERADNLARLQAAQGFLRRQIGGLYPLVERDRNGPPQSSFDGGREYARFIGLLPSHFGFSGFQRIEVGLMDDDDGQHLGVSWQAYGVEATLAEDDRRALLIEDIEAVELSYFGAKTRRGEARWEDEWHDAEQAPRLIRLRLDFADGDRRVWPELVVRTAIDTVLPASRDIDQDENEVE